MALLHRACSLTFGKEPVFIVCSSINGGSSRCSRAFISSCSVPKLLLCSLTSSRTLLPFAVRNKGQQKNTARLSFFKASATTESFATPAKEEFENEDDYLRAGGGELLFVKMQEKKEMKNQKKIADKLPPISSGGDVVLDLIVIGCGPAGLSLAAESAKKGLSVGLVGPDLPFTNNYGVWEDEFIDLGLQECIEHVWQDTAVYLSSNKPIRIGRAYGRVNRDSLHEELVKRCSDSGVTYLNCKVERIIDSNDGLSLVACGSGTIIPCRLAIVASGAASGKLLKYQMGGPEVTVQTAYGIEVEVENSPYDPGVMVFMDYRDYDKQSAESNQAEFPSFLYAMPLSATKIFFEETCLASRPTMSFDTLKKRLMTRLNNMDIRILEVHEEEWSYIPVGGSLPDRAQKNLAFGAAASMVHPATGYSIVRSLSEAPQCASKIAKMLKSSHSQQLEPSGKVIENLSAQAWESLWPKERRCQRAFFLFGLELILQLNTEGVRTFFETFFRLPEWLWRGFLGSRLSSIDLIWFSLYMFVIAPSGLRMLLVRHLLSHPSGATLVRTYLE